MKEDRELLMSLRTSPLYLEHLEAVRQKARNEGLEQGLEQGLERGRGERTREITLKLLNRKLGSLSAELITRVESLSIERLDVLSEALLNFQVVDDLIVWLKEN
jgi:flagellar biosynthesis/type III secretory pathway protein FliH